MGVRFPGKLSKKGLLVGLLLACVVTSFLGSRASVPLRSVMQYPLAPLGDIPMYLASAFERHVGGLQDISPERARRLLEENRQLRGQLLELSRVYQEYARQEQTKQYLYGRMKDFPCRLIPGRVVGAEPLPYGQTRIVGSGFSSGTRAGAGVTTRELVTDRPKALLSGYATIASTSLVGRIASAGAFTARLQLVTDRQFAIEAQLFRLIDPNNPRQIKVTRADAAAMEILSPQNNHLVPVFAQGDGARGLIVRDVSVNDNVMPGDWLITRRDDAFLLAGIRIGEVTKVMPNTEHPGFVTLHVQPHADLDALREVYIVVPVGDGPIESEQG